MDIIAAPATGAVRAALAVVRVSGEGCLELVARIFTPARGQTRPGRAVYGVLRYPDGRVLDTCVAVFNRAPASYTGEDTAELSVHGSPVLVGELLELLFSLGARQAGPGEFTKRAFLNGKMDLTGAEAVVDLIDAETAAAAANAAAQLTGGLFDKINGVYNALTELPAHFSALVDFPDEDVEPVDEARTLETLDAAAAALSRLEDSHRRSRVIKNGVAAVILGRPNVGKSSLLNALAGADRVIVSDIPGTTRDTVEEKLVLGGVLLRLIDTAGLRDTADPLEAMGVRRARDAAASAELALAVFDGPLTEDDAPALEAALRAPRRVAVFNKCDLTGFRPRPAPPGFDAAVSLSSKTGQGLDGLEAAVAGIFAGDMPAAPGDTVTNLRQAQAIGRARAAAERAALALRQGVTPDAVLLDVEEAMGALAEITGRCVRDDIVAGIFSRFCVGK